MGSRVMLTTVQSLEWPDTPCIPFFRQRTNEIVYISRNRDSFTFRVPILDIFRPILWFSYSFRQLGVGGPEKRTRSVQKSRTRKVKETWKIYLQYVLCCNVNFIQIFFHVSFTFLVLFSGHFWSAFPVHIMPEYALGYKKFD